MANANAAYKASSIEVLEGLEPVRRRPGMYIGGTSERGLQHLVKEIVDNSIDEAMNGYADRIVITLEKGAGGIAIEDNGRGIPVDKHPKFKKPAIELILTTLHAGGKFSDSNYASAGGLHGVGASVVNALSEEFQATVWRDGFEWTQSYERGRVVGPVTKGKRTKATGTRIYFRPDPEIFKVVTFQAENVEKLAQEKAFLNKGITVEFVDKNAGTKQSFCYEDGLRSYLAFELERAKLTPVGDEIFYLEKDNGLRIEAAFCWTEATSERLLSYVNGINTADGGSHVEGFRGGLSKGIRNYLSVHGLAPKGVKIGGEDMREGLVAVLSVNVPCAVSQLQFQGQTKDKLNNAEVVAPVETVVRGVENLLNSKPKIAAQIVERIVLASKARAAARVASQGVSRKVGVSHRLNLPGKLADCSSTSPKNSEILIVEGDSAGGSAKQGRDRKTQAVFPLRGKVLNAVSASAGKIKENRELTDLVSALGCGMGDGLRLEKLRYSKVIILTDADADGMHIASLLMAFFYRYMKKLIEAGCLYIGLSPLYRIRVGSGASEVTHWAYSDEEKRDIVKKIPQSKKVTVTRFKGLGEMNPKTLWETTLDPKSRNLLQIQIDDDSQAAEMLESLLGREASDRYGLIQENAHRLEVDV